MTNRIRYRKINENVLETKPFYHLTNGAQYILRINKKENMYYVLDAVTEIIDSSGWHADIRTLKREAKKALMNRGIVVEKEQRTRR